ncbi:SIS domain-containing protein [Bacteroidales bacterium OttesenSCG-928-K03]|nr:SIS domain-containing protein [Odoribacter sp. OttesenSCG-928-L07]MDL2242690.1 SIS domain-containing protein [Bacteroidales bacterium OttesenSCG-928-K03]
MNKNRISEAIKQSIEVKEKILNNSIFIDKIANIAQIIIDTYKSGGKVLIAGNGGSAADAQHIAAELSGKFYFDRDPLDAEALHVNTSYLTAVANDYCFNDIYSRAIKAKAKPGDVFIAISTSGNSQNLINAINFCNENKIITIGLTGENGGKMKDICNHILNVPSSDTPRIQEAHIMLGHILCELVETELFGNGK